VPDGEKPSRESMREVKKEYEARRKAEKERAEQADRYWAEQSGRATRSSGSNRTGPLIGAVAVVAAGGVALTALLHVGPFASASSATAAAGTTTAAPSSSLSPTPSGASASPSADDGTDPKVVAAFGDSPAKSWKVGAAGIVAPKGRQVGIYRPRQVSDAYARTSAYLKVALLDPRVVYRAKLDPVFAVLGTATTQWLKQQHARGTATKGKQGIAWDWIANRFHVGDWKASPEIRLKGRMRATQNSRGELVVHFVYVAAYWLVPAKGGAARTVAIRRTGDIYFVGNGSRRVTPPNYGGSTWTSTASVCGASWPYRDFVEAWTDPRSVDVVSPSPINTSFDAGDLDAPDPTGCFHDTSGFGG
jgi:hypothetical protein